MTEYKIYVPKAARYTEDINSRRHLRTLLHLSGFDWTETKGVGQWHVHREKVLVFSIVSSSGAYAGKLYNMARVSMPNEEEVFLTTSDVDVHHG